MTVVGHLLPGPEQHGVVRFGLDLAAGLHAAGAGGPVVRVATAELVGGAVPEPLRGCPLVHTQYTDRLYGATCEEAAARFVAVAAALGRAGSQVSVTLHDLPAPDGTDGAPPELSRRRAAAYRRVVAAGHTVVVCSAAERDRLAAFAPAAEPRVAVVPLPVPTPTPAPHPVPAVEDVTVLGFLYPGKGHEEVLRAMCGLPPSYPLVALGRVSDGHDDLLPRLRAVAAEHGRGVRVSGFVPDDDLPTALRAAGVPVAPHRHVSASGSIATWWGAGRRPLVPSVPYTRELLAGWPGSLGLYDDDLPAALATAAARPETTWLSDVAVGPSLAAVAAAYLEALTR